MGFDEGLRKAVQEALIEAETATRADRILEYPLEMTLTPDWYGYNNPAVTVEINSLSKAEPSHVKFKPVKQQGIVIMLPCEPGEVGAEQVTRSDSRRTCTIHMRAALRQFHLKFPEDRKLKLPIIADDVEIEGKLQRVVVIRVQPPATKKTEVRPRKKKSGTAPQPAPAPAPATGEQKA